MLCFAFSFIDQCMLCWWNILLELPPCLACFVNLFVQRTILGDCASHEFEGINVFKLDAIYGDSWYRGCMLIKQFSFAKTNCQIKQF